MRRFSVFVVSLFLIVEVSSAQGGSENYRFLHDYIDSLQKLESALSVRLTDLSFPELLNNLSFQLKSLAEAKAFLKPWLGTFQGQELNPKVLDQQMRENISQLNFLNLTALSLYQNISDLELDFSKTIASLKNGDQAQRDLLLKGKILKDLSGWSKFFASSENLMWLVMNKPSIPAPQGQIPFVISPEERISLFSYLDQSFGYKFRIYEELSSQLRDGRIKESQMDVSIPVYCALYLRYLFAVETYEEDRKVKQGGGDPFVYPRRKYFLLYQQKPGNPLKSILNLP